MTHPTWECLTVFEKVFGSQGLLVAGTDEVGRGPLAGPVVACAVILKPDAHIEGLDDSKRLSAVQRKALLPAIYESAVAVGIGAAGPRTIERVNILEAARLAMRRAIAHLEPPPKIVLSDAMTLSEQEYYTIALVRGDRRSASIAAASVVAKEVRDRYMQDLHRQFPHYGFDQHKGYGTKSHRQALDAWGPCAAHRRTFLRQVDGA
ncbi:MAG: ribonuclease HII [Sulfobacillus acidophilus]|uniref:Ribonuclease HII n=1 Tax=Sulfobacillus acidophilus TaxID=53633 RepID=A0A2T2WHZ2_9FIRM|nr:MAG: ribonuclease HII [Sulfobacillus acidophilus]